MINLRQIGLAGLAVAGVLLFTVPVSAAGSGAAVAVTGVTSAALPHTQIKGSPAVYSPAKLTATPHWNGVSTCTTALESFTVTNGTTASQEVTSGGQILGTLPAHSKAGICINTDEAGKTDTFGVASNTKAKLAVKVS